MTTKDEKEFLRELALKRLYEAKEEHLKGDNMALLWAIYLCAMNDFVMPDWVSKEYLRRFRKFLHFEEKDLGSAFGIAHPKGTQINALRKKRKNQIFIYRRVKELHQGDPKKYPIDEKLFATVGKEFYISGSTVRDYYYDFEKKLNPTYKNMPKPL